MKILRVVFAGLLGLTVAAMAQAATQVTVRFDLNSAPPPHMVFHGEPHVVYMPAQQVYVVDDPDVGDYDCFRYQGAWYAFRAGYWYRADRWNGRFVVIHPARVPVAVYHVPQARWRHHAVWAEEHKEARKEVRHDVRHDVKHDQHEDARHSEDSGHDNHGHGLGGN